MNLWLNLPGAMFLKRRLDLILNRFKTRGVETANSTVDAFFKIWIVILILATFLWISIFMYVAFYYSYVPSNIHKRPVYLQYSTCEDKENSCEFPRGHVSLTKTSSILMLGQPYKISLALDMPESPVNKELGMFMVCVELLGQGKVTVGHSCRPTILHYSSPLVQVMRTFIFAPFYIMGYKKEKQTLNIEVFPQFLDDQEYPVTAAVVEVKSQAVEIYSCDLLVSAQMGGLRYLMFHYPFSSAAIGVSFNFLSILFLTFLSLWQLYRPSTNREKMLQQIEKMRNNSVLEESDSNDRSEGTEESVSEEGEAKEEVAEKEVEVSLLEEDEDFIMELKELATSTEA